MTTLLAFTYLACFQLCAIPSVVRIVRRGSSQDLSVWREVLLICGASTQLVVMTRTGAAWQVWVSPVATLINVSVLLGVILYFRR